MKTSPTLRREADLITEHLRAIRLILKRPVEALINESGLTTPQVALLQVLAGNNGLSLKDLSARLGLAHSTVSGIVDRLQRRGLVRRQADPADKRFMRIYLTEAVKSYVKEGAALHHPGPLIDALRAASPRQQSQIRAGLLALRKLLEKTGAPTVS